MILLKGARIDEWTKDYTVFLAVGHITNYSPSYIQSTVPNTSYQADLTAPTHDLCGIKKGEKKREVGFYSKLYLYFFEDFG